MRLRRAPTKRVVVGAVIAGALIAAGGGVAAAGFNAHAAPARTITAGTYRWAISGGGTPTSGPVGLLPGTAPEVFTFEVADAGTLRQQLLVGTLAVTVTAHTAGCGASDFVTGITAGAASGTTLSPGGHVTVTVSVSLATTVTTDACEGSTPTVTLSIDASD